MQCQFERTTTMKNTIEVNPRADKIINLIGTSNIKVYLIVKEKKLPLEKSIMDYVKLWYSPNGYLSGSEQYVCRSGWENNISRRCSCTSLQELFDSIIEYGYEIVLLGDQEKALELLKNNL